MSSSFVGLPLLSSDLTCPNNCSNGNGHCIESECRCYQGFTGEDCSIPIQGCLYWIIIGPIGMVFGIVGTCFGTGSFLYLCYYVRRNKTNQIENNSRSENGE